MHDLHPAVLAIQPLLTRDAEQPLDAGTDVDHEVVFSDAVDVDDRREAVDDASVANLEVVELRLEIGHRAVDGGVGDG